MNMSIIFLLGFFCGIAFALISLIFALVADHKTARGKANNGGRENYQE